MKEFLLGFISYFIISTIFALIGIDRLLVRGIITFSILAIVYIINKYKLKRRSLGE